MRFSHATALVLATAGNAWALSSPKECLAAKGQQLAAFADCGNHDSATKCLVELTAVRPDNVAECFSRAGCSAAEAAVEADNVLARCQELSQTGELRKRFQGMGLLERADATLTDAAVFARATTDEDSATTTEQTGPIKTGDACFTTTKKSTSDCPLTTEGGKTQTGDCTATEIDVSKCAPTMLCTKNPSNDDICMEKKGMATGGIIVAIVFAGATAVGLGGIIFMSCKDSKEQKRLTAKAEAVSLARAATKKKAASDAAQARQDRAPLMRGTSQNSAAGSGAGDPFSDQPGRVG